MELIAAYSPPIPAPVFGATARALGLTRAQLRWMLLWEAALIAGVASVLGLALGAAYGVLGTSAALAGEANLKVGIPWLQLLLILAVATTAGALASVLPSRRAARISPVAAIAAAVSVVRSWSERSRCRWFSSPAPDC